MEEFLLAKKMENLLTLWNLLRKLLQDHHFAFWGKISTFSTDMNVALSVSTSLQRPLGNFPLNLLVQSFATQQKYQVQKQNIRVSETSSDPCNWDPGLHQTQLSAETSASLMKYTLGRAALSRAHHMLLINHNFSAYRHMQEAWEEFKQNFIWLHQSTDVNQNEILPRCHKKLLSANAHHTHPAANPSLCQHARLLQEKSTVVYSEVTVAIFTSASHQWY